jgi:hypothetical protein
MRSDVQEVFKLTPHDKQVMMFSATLDKEVRPICKKFMTDVSSASFTRGRGKASFSSAGGVFYGDSGRRTFDRLSLFARRRPELFGGGGKGGRARRRREGRHSAAAAAAAAAAALVAVVAAAAA